MYIYLNTKLIKKSFINTYKTFFHMNLNNIKIFYYFLKPE